MIVIQTYRTLTNMVKLFRVATDVEKNSCFCSLHCIPLISYLLFYLNAHETFPFSIFHFPFSIFH